MTQKLFLSFFSNFGEYIFGFPIVSENHTFSCVLLGYFIQKYLSARPFMDVLLAFMNLGTLCSERINPDANLHIISLTHGIFESHQRFYSYVECSFFSSLLYSVLISLFTQNENIPKCPHGHNFIKNSYFDPSLFCPLGNCLGKAFFAVRAKLK